MKAVFSLHFHFKATECSEEITESFFSTVNHLGVNSLSFTSDNLFYWDSAQVVSESLKNPNVSFIQETLNFQGSFVRIYQKWLRLNLSIANRPQNLRFQKMQLGN